MDAMKQVCEIGCEEESWDVRVKACRSQSPCPPARRAPFGALGAPLEIATLGKNIRNAGSPARAARPEMEGHAAWRQRRWRRDGGEQGRGLVRSYCAASRRNALSWGRDTRSVESV
jgi:hypothetical protein